MGKNLQTHSVDLTYFFLFLHKYKIRYNFL